MTATFRVTRILCAAFILAAAVVVAQAPATTAIPKRIVLGGKAVFMTADLVYAFPAARESVVGVAGTDQGLGTFLEAVAPGYLRKPALDRQAGAEAYAALRPDLVILKSSARSGIGKNLEAIGIRVLYLDLEKPEDYPRDLAALGKALGQEARAAELSAYYAEILARTKPRDGTPRPSVLIVQATPNGYEVPPDSWIQTTMVGLAGGRPVWSGANPGSGWAAVSAEQIAAWAPDHIVVISYRGDAAKAAESLRADARFAGLGAVAGRRVHAFPQDFHSWDQPDVRWGLGLQWLAGILNPARKENLEARAFEFFKLFYGFDQDTFAAVIKPLLNGDWK